MHLDIIVGSALGDIEGGRLGKVDGESLGDALGEVVGTGLGNLDEKLPRFVLGDSVGLFCLTHTNIDP